MMNRMLLVAFAVACCSATPEYIDGEYIAVLRSNTSRAMHTALSQKFGGTKISIGTFQAMFLKATPEQAALLAGDESVDFVEQNTMGHVQQVCGSTQTGASWGTARNTATSPREVNANNPVFRYSPQWGAGVDAYILDTGIMCTHTDFTGRCTFGATFVGGSGADGHGHGTHVAGTVGGTTWGTAKQVQLVAVKVCTDAGSCPTSGTMSAFEWVAARYRQTGRPSVVNLSLGGGRSEAYNAAANALVAVGVHVVAAAGNSNADTCNFSPASAANVVTVGSTQLSTQSGVQIDSRSSFSNWGTCVDLFAPGSNIRSAANNPLNPSGSSVMSGTSMACPQVAGALSQYLSVNPSATPAAAKSFLVSSAQSNMVSNPGTGTPNRMLHIQC